MLADVSAPPAAAAHPSGSVRLAIMWRGDPQAEQIGIASNERLRPVFDALTDLGATPEAVVYRDEIADAVKARLAEVDGVLVWVDPVSVAGTRDVLDGILRDVAAAGVWVSAHPDVIDVIGTKDVLFDTREIGWSADVHRYRSIDELRAGLPERLRAGARVLKPRRGNGGYGVWKVELAHSPVTASVHQDTRVRVHHALIRDLNTKTMPLREFLDRCERLFVDDDCVIDQAFQPRVADGLIRVYLVGDEIVGFGRQGAGELLDEPGGAALVMGLPAPNTMLPPDHPTYQPLRRLVGAWVPAMQRVLGVATEQLPVLWDADFLLGPPSPDGHDTYVLCEINASCVTPFPPDAPSKLAAAVMRHVSNATAVNHP